MSEWQPIDKPPTSDMAVLVYFANRRWRALDESIVPPDPVRDIAERTEPAFYQNGEWCEVGTAHDLFEMWREADEFPTHWTPLSPPRSLSQAADTEKA